jgi:hypothetical protein
MEKNGKEGVNFLKFGVLGVPVGRLGDWNMGIIISI